MVQHFASKGIDFHCNIVCCVIDGVVGGVVLRGGTCRLEQAYFLGKFLELSHELFARALTPHTHVNLQRTGCCKTLSTAITIKISFSDKPNPDDGQ